MSGVLHHVIKDTPIAVLDFETTGLSAGNDRVVEVSVVRIEPGLPPRLVLDTLINPRRRVAATHIHGITDRHVVDPPGDLGLCCRRSQRLLRHGLLAI